MEILFFYSMIAISVAINISSLDDIFIDVIAFGIRRGGLPKTAKSVEVPSIAVFIANWHEEEVLGKMVEGNLARIPYMTVSLYLGVYPNDTGTLSVARNLAEKHPIRVTVIVNWMQGPTSKGQMLNEMFKQVFEGSGESPDIVVLHDSEDVIDPRAFEVYGAYAQLGYDFIQVPVFSLNRGRALIASTYMDEFAERHTREMIVRNAVGATIPSAGVGTGVTRKLIQHFLATRKQVLMSGTVTEDYILGVEAKRAGFKAAFAAVSADDPRGLDFVATREFFPKTLSASIKQKTRWVYGINFEAMHKLGWEGDGWDKYFFVRDRKGMVTNFLPPVSLALLMMLFMGAFDLTDMPYEWQYWFNLSILFNMFALVMRYFIRVGACHQVYGTWDLLGIALRWPVALYINMAAVYRAWITYVGVSRFATQPIVWSKTAHELPEDFMSAKR